jgi:hypothetical protein
MGINASNPHGYWSIYYKLTRRNIDIGTLNRDKKFQCILVIWGKFYEDIQGWQADFRIATRGAYKRGGLKNQIIEYELNYLYRCLY